MAHKQDSQEATRTVEMQIPAADAAELADAMANVGDFLHNYSDTLRDEDTDTEEEETEKPAPAAPAEEPRKAIRIELPRDDNGKLAEAFRNAGNFLHAASCFVGGDNKTAREQLREIENAPAAETLKPKNRQEEMAEEGKEPVNDAQDIAGERIATRDALKMLEEREGCVSDSGCAEPPAAPLLKWRGGGGILEQGHIAVIKGRAKSGKTTLASIFAAAAMGQNEVGNLRAASQGLRVVYFDTYHGKKYVDRWLSITQGLCGWSRTIDGNPRLRGFSLRGVDKKTMREGIEAYIKEEKPDLVIIDGVNELMTDCTIFEAEGVMFDLQGIVGEFNCAILGVVWEDFKAVAEVLSKSDERFVVRREDKHLLPHFVCSAVYQDVDEEEFDFLTFVKNGEYGQPTVRDTAEPLDLPF